MRSQLRVWKFYPNYSNFTALTDLWKVELAHLFPFSNKRKLAASVVKQTMLSPDSCCFHSFTFTIAKFMLTVHDLSRLGG